MIIKQRIQKADGTIKYRNYLKQGQLGKGGFGQCFQVQRIQDHKQFALKIIDKKLLVKNKARQKMLSQIRLHRTSKHKNICQLQRAFEDDDNVYMLLQLCKHRNLFELMQRRKRLTPQQTQYYMLQIIDGLCYLHNKKIVHRDIKLGNLLLNEKMELKIADFGLATDLQFIGDRKHTVCGTPNYIAPQIIRSSLNLGPSGYSFEVDIWSLGVILFVMLTGKAPFQTDKLELTYRKICKADFQFPSSFKDEAGKDLIRKILQVDPSKRYTFQEILEHPFMNPTNGIPKQIPSSSLFSTPKFVGFTYSKYQSQDIKQSARNASINTLRSSIDNSIQQDFHEPQTPRSKRQSSRSSSRDVKGLLRSVFSGSSISKSIEKINNLGNSLSSNLSNLKYISNKSSNGDKISSGTTNTTSSKNLVVPSNTNNGKRLSSSALISSSSTSAINNMKNNTNQKIDFHNPVKTYDYNPEKANQVFILDYKKQIIWSYVLSNGYIGTYESQEDNYKILFNPIQKIYYQIHNDGLPKKIKQDHVIMNQNVHNRLKFVQNFNDAAIQIISKNQSLINPSKNLIYLKRIFQVKPESIILFKFSNNDIQMLNYETNKSLLVTDQQLIMLQIAKGKQVMRLSQKKDQYIQCKNKELISMYLKVKKILIKISNLGKD